MGNKALKPTVFKSNKITKTLISLLNAILNRAALKLCLPLTRLPVPKYSVGSNSLSQNLKHVNNTVQLFALEIRGIRIE